MKLTVISFLLLVLSAHASLFSAAHPRHLNDLAKDAKLKLGHALPSALQTPSGIIHRRRRTQQCKDEGSEALEEALDFARTTYYENVVCVEDEYAASQNCTWDMSEAVADGVIDDAIAVCAASNNGVMFTFNAEISCDDDSSFSMIDSPFACFSNCDNYSQLEALVPLYFPAYLFVGKNETEVCNWDAFSMNPLNESAPMDDDHDETVDGSDDEEEYVNDDDSPFGDTCTNGQNEEFDSVFYTLYFQYLESLFTCEDDNPSNCHLDFSQAIEDSAFDVLPSLCHGELYISSLTVDCGSEEGGTVKYSSIPGCFDNCSVDFLTQSAFVEGGSAGDNCTFSDVGEIYVYGDEGEEGVDVDDDTTEDDEHHGHEAKSPKKIKATKNVKMPKKTKKNAKKTKGLKSSKSTTPMPMLNGEEACEGHEYTKEECLAIGDGCCHWNDWEFEEGLCFSDIGRDICHM